METTALEKSIPIFLSIAAFFISILLLFWGLRYYNANSLENIGTMLSFCIPSLWMMGFAIYLWVIGKEN